MRGWALADVAEAAVHGGGDLDLVRGFLHDWQKVATATQAPHLEVQVACAQALLAGEASAPARFDLAVQRGAEASPFGLARAQLADGEWLRRQRRDTATTVTSLVPLAAHRATT